MGVAGIDQNSRATLTALSNANDGAIVALWADPTTHRLLVDNANSTSIAVGTTTITGGTTTRVLYDNAGVVGEYTISGSGTVVAMATSPSLTTPSLGVATATSINGNIFTVGSSTYTGTAGQTYTFPTTSATIARTDAANTFTGASTASAWVLTSPTITTKISPTSDDGAPLGDTTHNFSDLFLASGGVINFANSNVTITHSSALLTFSSPITLGTSNAFTCGSIELGNASANTLTASGGVLSIEGVVIPTISSTNTFTNKRRTRRVVTVNNPGATPTINSDNNDVAAFTGCANAITSMTTNLSGTPVTTDLMEIQFTDNGTARGITWGASFVATTVALPTTTVISTLLRVFFEWNGSAWACIGTA